MGTTTAMDGLAQWSRAVRHGHGAGLPLDRLFDQQAKNGPADLRLAAGRIAQRLRDGDSLEAALEDEKDLPTLFTALAALGERTGRTPEVFGQLEEYYRSQASARREFWANARWPLFQFVAGVLVIAFVIAVLGMIAPAEGDATGASIGFGFLGPVAAFVFLLIVAGVVGGGYFFVRGATQTLAGRAGFEAKLLTVPMLGPALLSAAMARFCIALKLTLDSSMSLPKALRLSFRATDNAAFQQPAEAIVKKVGKGSELTVALGKHPLLPTEFLAMVNVGEASGELPETMARQAVQYQEEAARRLKALARAMAWGVYGLVGLFLVVAIFRIAMVYVQALNG